MAVRNIPGLHFLPTDDELVNNFLLNQALKRPLPCDGIFINRNPYATSPWLNFTSQDPWQVHTKSTWVDKTMKHKTYSTLYVFTTLKKAGETRVSRRAGVGTWHGEAKAQSIFDDNNSLIGVKKNFLFEVNDESFDCRSVRGCWYMEEFSLTGISGSSDIVLCKIKRDDTKSTKHVSDRLGKKRAPDQVKQETETADLQTLCPQTPDDSCSTLPASTIPLASYQGMGPVQYIIHEGAGCSSSYAVYDQDLQQNACWSQNTYTNREEYMHDVAASYDPYSEYTYCDRNPI